MGRDQLSKIHCVMVEEPGDGSVMDRKLQIGGSRGGATLRERGEEGRQRQWEVRMQVAGRVRNKEH